jgi:hypothetical protein
MVDKFISTAKETKKFDLVCLDNFDGETIYKYFRNDIRQLLHTYPLDAKTKDG